MCGILTLITSENSALDKDKFGKALKRQEFRGPDSHIVEQINLNCLMGANRLAIQDLTAKSEQPFCYKDNWLVFNGEIYNYKELRDDLIKKSVNFTTSGDIEVLAAGLTTEGIDFLYKVNGIFAFVFYNAITGIYLVARDKLGVKPLFYSEHNNEVIFSSDIKSILDYMPVELNLSAIKKAYFLDWFVGYKKEETFFNNIFSVPNGTYHVYNMEGKLIENTRYYVPQYENFKFDLFEVERDFKKLVNQVFAMESKSDAKAGFILSGGIDTSTIAVMSVPYLLQRQEKIPVFTLYYQKKGEDIDLQYAQKVVTKLKEKYGDVFEFYKYNMDAEITLEDFKEAAIARETPVFDIRFITMLKFFQNIRKDTDVKMCLSGQGSDEIFYGYYSVAHWFTRLYREGDVNALNILNYYQDIQNKNRAAITRADFWASAKNEANFFLKQVFNSLPTKFGKEKLLTAFLRETELQTVFLYEDKLSMYSSIEVRVPLVNPLLVDYIDRYNYEINIASSVNGRHLFRSLLKDELPNEIVFRGKTPTPKKRHYLQELKKIIKENSDGILSSPLLKMIYREDFLERICGSKGKGLSERANDFYGSEEDILFELIGFYVFEATYL